MHFIDRVNKQKNELVLKEFTEHSKLHETMREHKLTSVIMPGKDCEQKTWQIKLNGILKNMLIKMA